MARTMGNIALKRRVSRQEKPAVFTGKIAANPETKVIAEKWLEKNSYLLKSPAKMRVARAIITANQHLSPEDFARTALQRLNVMVGE